MTGTFNALKVTDNVYWVGAIDFAVRDFHGYLTSRGTTYNAYLVTGEKVALIDTVKAGFADEMLARIASVTDPRKIDVIVSNHAEPDHSGSLTETIAACEPEKVYASKKGCQALRAHYGLDGVLTAVEDGQTLSLGNLDLTCVETPMCHWPDSMVTYLHEDELLFSQDIFGMHLATYEMFDDLVDESVMDHEAAKYYANILLPLSAFVTKALRRVEELDISLKIIAPDHGPIWRDDPAKIVRSYVRWATQPRVNKAIVVYDTMWKSTERMARAIGEGLASGGAHTRLMPMSSCHRSDVATELMDAGALVVGAPTLNAQMFPTVADVLTYVKGLRPRGLIGAAFGSYGWGARASKQIGDMLETMQVELVAEPLEVNYVPGTEALKRCYELGRTIAAKLRDKFGHSPSA